jgi:hypothetical protein
MPRRVPVLGGVALACVALVALVWTRGYDLDQDGWPDSIRLGASDVHLMVTRERQGRPSGLRVDGGRLYRVPPAYVHVLVKKAFDWDSRWDLLQWDASSRVSEAIRLEDKARVSVRVDEWRGWSLVRVSVRQPGAGSSGEAATAVFQCLETVLFYGIATPQTVRGFAPR